MLLGVCAADYVGGAKPAPTNAPPRISAPFCLGAAGVCASPSALAASCTNLPGRKVMIAHSLGNVLVSSAAVDHNLDYDRYYMLNAAVAMEAYDRAELSEDMVDSNWATNDVPLAYRASRWSGMFGSDDFRSMLGLSALTREDVIENPLFTPFRNESERMNSTNLFPVADAAATPQLRARFLADAIPAESHAAGANYLSVLEESGNIRMDTSSDNGCMANVDRWPRGRTEEIEDDDGNVVGKILRWEHSDLKNLAYFFVYRLFDRIVR